MERSAGAAILATAFLAVGCAVERFTAVERNDEATTDAGTSDGDAPIEGSSVVGTGSEDGAEVANACTAEKATCSASNTGCNVGSYYLYDNQYGCGADSGAHCGQESAYGCANGDGSISFVVTSDQPTGTTGVLAYSAIQDNLGPPEPAVSSFSVLSASFAERSPHLGVYDCAFDVWLNGIGAGATQIKIWVDFSSQRMPSGSKVGTYAPPERTYDVWSTPDGSLVTLVSTATVTSGSVDLLGIFNWAITQGRLKFGSTLSQIEFGFEIVSTAGASGTFAVDEFSLVTH